MFYWVIQCSDSFIVEKPKELHDKIKDYFDNSVGNCIVNSVIILYQLHILEFNENSFLYIHPSNKVVYDLINFMHTYLDHKEILDNKTGRLYINEKFESFKEQFNQQYSNLYTINKKESLD